MVSWACVAGLDCSGAGGPGPGERDPMVSVEQLAVLVPAPVELPGLGHNAHVEDPALTASLVSGLRNRRPR
ncbi:hypothetical protein Psuf_067310 [Phytohabitans suffuscus]|uniref:AB hydrolase-1 domain-containing protein n=1 Tax=Phytohabitans suffuscus TaxID=624315 RepID=A0A6F8YU07_9ACTN|nr:hypothetical protein Psuf_067310 [Phytohabitans suffuscus]